MCLHFVPFEAVWLSPDSFTIMMLKKSEGLTESSRFLETDLLIT